MGNLRSLGLEGQGSPGRLGPGGGPPNVLELLLERQTSSILPPMPWVRHMTQSHSSPAMQALMGKGRPSIFLWMSCFLSIKSQLSPLEGVKIGHRAGWARRAGTWLLRHTEMSSAQEEGDLSPGPTWLIENNSSIIFPGRDSNFCLRALPRPFCWHCCRGPMFDKGRKQAVSGYSHTKTRLVFFWPFSSSYFS